MPLSQLSESYRYARALRWEGFLLIANGATDNDALLHSLRTTALPKYAAIGRHVDGSWRTSELKQYPADFCKAICRVILEGQKGHGDAPWNFSRR